MKLGPARRWSLRALVLAAVPALVAMAGCGGGSVSGASNGTFSISPGASTIDTNCTGCNATNTSGTPLEQFSATLNSGGGASVTWSVSGGDANSGAGSITASGQYTPPSYLTANSVQVTVTAALASSSPSIAATATVTITPGFLQPLTPENVALGSGGTVILTGYIAEAGGTTGINYAVSSSSTGSSGGQGTLGTTACTRSSNAFTYCAVTYTAPQGISATSSTYLVATVGSSSSHAFTQVLLNSEGISSNPASHQAQLPTPILLGSSGGNNNDYDAKGNQILDCCGGTLGALIQNSSGTQYLLSCNHVLARSDQAATGESIIQPGLIDDNCEPTNGSPAGTETQVGVLTAWVPLNSTSSNVDAAIAAVDSGAVNSSGAIQELGTLQNGILTAAPPGISSTSGTGEIGSLNLTVAKSGRTTGLTCASISVLNLDVQVSYFENCEETEPYLTKNYTNQIGIEGNNFSDAGDSGSLVVDTGNAEPVGLFFAGGVTSTGVAEGVANPAPAVLAELGAQEGATYTFVGAPDHPVSCLNYGAGTASAAQATTLTAAQSARAEQALTQARMLINPSGAILGAAAGQSSDHAGESAVILYVDRNMNAAVPQTVDGVRTEAIYTTAHELAAGTAPQSAAAPNTLPPLAPVVFNQALVAKQQIVQGLIKQNPAFFGVGVGQSYDDPKEAALVIYVDRNQIPATLPVTIDGLRTRYIVMDRLHVTRSYLNTSVRRQSHCLPHPARQREPFDPSWQFVPHSLNLHF